VSAARFEVEPGLLSRPLLEALLADWSASIPVGDEVHRRPVAAEPLSLSTQALRHASVRLVPRHLGTLGGGNHFVELDVDVQGHLWLLAHSGSRGVGAAIATHHRGVAGGALRPLEGEAGEACLHDFAEANAFAASNRAALLTAAAQALVRRTGARAAAHFDVPHNFVQREWHQGQALTVHRKGAIRATRGELALIPGSMGTASYVVEGLGEPLAFHSASHGAGRVLTRQQAHRAIPRARLLASMRQVVFDRGRPNLEEEAPAAYRDVREVLAAEADLVRPVTRLTPLLVLKG
jgi:tRNA-splicing ligase RtcB